MNQGLWFSSEVADSSLQDCWSHCVVQDLAWLKMYIYMGAYIYGCVYVWLKSCCGWRPCLSQDVCIYIYMGAYIYMCVYVWLKSFCGSRRYLAQEVCIYIYQECFKSLEQLKSDENACGSSIIVGSRHCFFSTMHVCVHSYIYMSVCGSSHCVARSRHEVKELVGSNLDVSNLDCCESSFDSQLLNWRSWDAVISELPNLVAQDASAFVFLGFFGSPQVCHMMQGRGWWHRKWVTMLELIAFTVFLPPRLLHSLANWPPAPSSRYVQ